MKNNLPELRREMDMRQGDLAEALDVTRQTINAIERERYNPSLDLAFKIANFFDCQIEDIFEYHGSDS